MDIKDRLNIAHILKPEMPRAAEVRDDSENAQPEGVSFDENETVLGILTEKLNSGANIIYVSDQNKNKKTIALLLKNYVRRNKQVVFPVTRDEYSANAVNFIPELSGGQLIEILSASVSGISSFVAGMDLNSYGNIFEKLETLIALNSGISEKYIKILLREFSPVFVNISEANGVYTVKSIDKTVEKNLNFEVKNIYSYISGQTFEEAIAETSRTSILPDFKSILEETVAVKKPVVSKKPDTVENELIINNPVLKDKTDKYTADEFSVDLNEEKISSKQDKKAEEAVVSNLLDDKSIKEIIDEVLPKKEEVPAPSEEPGIIPSIKNILADDVDSIEEKILSDIKSEDEPVLPEDNAEKAQIKEENDDENNGVDPSENNSDETEETQEIVEEAPENIDITIPAQATPVNKYKALREKIKNKKEK